MARIPDSELERLKKEVPLEREKKERADALADEEDDDV